MGKLFFKQDNMGDIWSLFAGIKPESNQRINHTEEIIKSALNGKIRIDDFNLYAYEEVCQRNSPIKGDVKGDRDLNAVYITNSEEESAGWSPATVSQNALGYEEKKLDDFIERKVSEDARAVLIELAKASLIRGISYGNISKT